MRPGPTARSSTRPTRSTDAACGVSVRVFGLCRGSFRGRCRVSRRRSCGAGLVGDHGAPEVSGEVSFEDSSILSGQLSALSLDLRPAHCGCFGLYAARCPEPCLRQWLTTSIRCSHTRTARSPVAASAAMTVLRRCAAAAGHDLLPAGVQTDIRYGMAVSQPCASLWPPR